VPTTAHVPEAPPAALPAWREEDSRLELLAAECDACSTLTHPPVRECHSCGGYSPEPKLRPLSGRGRVYACTTVHVAHPAFTTPYTVGFVDVPEGLRIVAQVRADAGEPAMGDQVAVERGVLRVEDGEPVEGYVFRVVAP
jgi:uncharacterized protein